LWLHVGRLLADYGRYLFDERALTEHTVLVRYVPVARLFLDGVMGAGGLELERLTASEVSSFLARECPRRSVAGARELVVALRSFLRYLHIAGLIAMPLQWAVPGVADLRDRSLPRGLEPAVVKRLLGSCDRRRTVGRRDYAILLLLSRLGLRAGEVAALTLDDLDWHSGTAGCWQGWPRSTGCLCRSISARRSSRICAAVHGSRNARCSCA
jgi:integrase